MSYGGDIPDDPTQAPSSGPQATALGGFGGANTLADVVRDPGAVPDERSTLVKQKIKDVKKARKFWADDFKRMKADQDLLLGMQWPGQKDLDDDRYIVNVTQRHIQQRTAAVYAKNPTVVARAKPMMDFKIWDENPVSYQMATQTMAMAGQISSGAKAGDPNAQAQAATAIQNPDTLKMMAIAQTLLADVQEGMMRRQMKNRVCKTMEIYFRNKVLSQQNPPFKAQMKQLVRRTLAAGIGYIKLGFVREMAQRPMSPDELSGMATMQERMAQLELFMADLADDKDLMDGCCGEKEELRLMMEAIRTRPNDVVQEGIIFDFPSATSIIPDWRLTHLQGFVGCEFVAEEYLLSPDDVQKVWKVDVSGQCNVYEDGDESAATSPSPRVPTDGNVPRGDDVDKKGNCCVWVIYDRTTGLTYTVCDGYKDFLEEPTAPPLTLERFFPWYSLGFNYIEHHKQRYPLSDCFMMRSEQREMNRCREGLRQHRIANRPLTAVAAGMMSETDLKKMEERPANGVVQLNGLAPGAKISDLLQVVGHPPLNPELYDTSPQFEDILRTVGTQEANLGGTSNSTATESSIAESSRMSSLQSNMDDLDDFLTEIMRDAGKVALMEISAEQVTRVVGVGATWPTLSNQDVADEIFLEIVAGSSGRPNKAQEIQNFTQAAPFLLQLPGMSPEWLARQMLTRLDDRLDLTDAFAAGQPSIQTLNALASKPLNQPASDPNAKDSAAQGAEGQQNQPAAPGAGGALGAQPANAMPPAAPPMAQ